MMPLQYDAIIVGGGPAGATAAIRLARAGWSVALIEGESFPRRKVCGECIAASNLPLLDALGVGERFAALAGPPLRRVALLWGRESISAPLPAAAGSRQPWGRALGREQLDLLLLERARQVGVAVWQPYTAQSLGGSPGAYCCVLRPTRDHGQISAGCDSAASPGAASLSLTAPVAIAANGSWQRLPAERAQQPTRARGADLLAFKANFIGARLEAGVLPVLAFAGGYGGMVLADGGLLTLACCIQRSALQRARRADAGSGAGDTVQACLQQHCRGVADALASARRTGEWLATGPIRPGLAVARRDTALPPFRIGNAAGEAHPLVGEGISMAMQSAWLLSALLIDCPEARRQGSTALRTHQGLHARYSAQWRRHFMARMRLAACLAAVAMRPAAMRAVLPLLRRSPGLLTHAARGSGKIRSLHLGPQETTS